MRLREGVWYPDSEERLHRGHSAVWTIDQFIKPHLRSTEYCVQAGGAVGVWPLKFAEIFDKVYTFEPNPVLWECMQRNFAEYPSDNIEAMHAAVYSESGGTADMVDIQSNNMGAWHIKFSDDEDKPPVVALDDLQLPGCDLLQLDIEGAEIHALKGAKETIMAYRPAIVVEVKAPTLRAFHQSVEELHSVIGRRGYKRLKAFARDEMWIPL